MLKISPTVSLVFKLSNALLAAVATIVGASPEHFGGKPLADNIVFWITTGLTLEGVIYSCVGTGAVPSQTVIGKVA